MKKGDWIIHQLGPSIRTDNPQWSPIVRLEEDPVGAWVGKNRFYYQFLLENDEDMIDNPEMVWTDELYKLPVGKSLLNIRGFDLGYSYGKYVRLVTAKDMMDKLDNFKERILQLRNEQLEFIQECNEFERWNEDRI